MTATATITAQYVDAPKNGNAKAPWSVKDAMGQRWKFWPDRAGRIDVGQTVTVEWKEGDEYQGKRDQIITKVLGTSGDTGPTAPRASNGSAAPVASAPRQQTHPEDAKRMWTCAVLVAAIEAGKVDPFDGSALTDVCHAAGEAYANVFKGN